MTSLTVVTVLVVFLGAFTRLGWPRAMSLGGATAAGAALSLGGGVVVPTFYAVALAAIGFTALGAAQRHRLPVEADPVPGLLPLIGFGLWAIIVTAVAPLIFNNALVLDAAGQQTTLGAAGLMTTSNIAQLAYLWIGIAVLVIVARSPQMGIDAVGLGLAVATLLNTWALLHRDVGVPFPEGFFDNSPNFRFIDSAPGGVERFRGILPEPSAVSAVAIPMLVFAAAYLPRSSGWKRLGALVLIGLSVWTGIASTSASFIVSGVLMLVIALVVGVLGFTTSRSRIHTGGWMLLSSVGIALVFVLPVFMDFVAAIINSKVDSTSYDERSGADTFSFLLSIQTLGFGVGLGSNRPSSFVASLLSQTGVVGFVLYVLFVAEVLRRSIRVEAVRPVLWVAVCMFVGKIYNGPDMSDSTGLTWLVLGVLAGAALRQNATLERPDDIRPVAPFIHDSLVPRRKR